MLDFRSPTKADYCRHPHHLRFASNNEGGSPRAASSPASKLGGSASAHSSPMLGGAAASTSAARLAEHFQARSFSLSTPSPSVPPTVFQPRVLDDVFGSPSGVPARRADRPPAASCASTGDAVTPTGRLGKLTPSWLSGATVHEQSLSLASSSYLPAPNGGSSSLPLFSPFDPFAATSSSAPGAAKSPGLSLNGSPPPTTPSTAYIESLTRAHRGSFHRSLSSASTSSSFSASGPDPVDFDNDTDDDDDGRLAFPRRPAHELVSPSGESLADVTDFYFSSDAGVDVAQEEDEEMMTESDLTECTDVRASRLLSPTRSERSSYAEQLREYTLSVRLSKSPSRLLIPGSQRLTTASISFR